MATIVAEALLSASVKVLLKKIISREFVKFFRSRKLDVSLLEKLKITLLSLEAVLHDAEEKQITNPGVKEWLVMLQDAVFEADNLFDEINTEGLRCKLKVEYEGIVSAKVQNIFSSLSKKFDRAINSKMKKLLERLEYLRKQKLGLEEGVSRNVWHGTPTSSVVDESFICGRDSDRKKLKDFLLSEDASDGGGKIGVISIVGMGGLGKTTLARLLYNDPEVNEKFDLKGWAHISKDFDVCRVTKTLLESVTSKTSEANNLNILQVQLQQSLSHKTFLLILDDIWDASYANWNNLKDIFNVGEMGSRIIITTRDERVALPMQTFLFVHHLRPLESEDCWSLLSRHAFVESNYQQRSNLEVIGKEISNKCKGLPLAATAIGGILRIKLSQDYWNDVLKSSIWELSDDGVQPALLMSYRFLPAPLKGCFAYCSIFPKNFLLIKNMVVQLWIAEGLVAQPKSHKSWEKVAEEYFDELVSRSLIHRQVLDGKEYFEMHDLINDLATMVSSPYCTRLDEQDLDERVRYLSYNGGPYHSFNNFDKLYGLKGLRTLLLLPPQWSCDSISDKVVGDLLAAMRQLRVLSLSIFNTMTKLPNSIGNLTYMRYLNLSKTGIERLPSETCNLYNLQTLLLACCKRLTELPDDIGKLMNLRHLDISDTPLSEMPIEITKLQNLQILSGFVVGRPLGGLKIAALGKFPHLQGKLTISKLQNVTNPSDAFQANLEMKKQIDELVLEWSSTTSSDSIVLEQLRPSTNLKNLSICYYSGNNFPKWLGDSSFGNMVYLKIWNCPNCSWLPPVGQLANLKELVIRGMHSVKTVGAEFYGSSGGDPSFQPFPSLETLSFEDMREWEEWKFIGGTTREFPSLRCLIFRLCLKLKGNILNNIPSLTELKLWQCPLLVESGHSDDNSNIISLRLPPVGQLMLPPLNSLRHLTIGFIRSLMTFPRDGLPKTLQSLRIIGCGNLDFLPHNSLHNYTSLEELVIIESCSSKTLFTMGSLPVLKSLIIDGCENLKSILTAEDATQQSLSFLRSIQIKNCHELESFSPGGLRTPNLIHFKVDKCKKLRSLPEPMNTLAGLQQMEISNLPNLQSIARDGLPTGLRHLTVGQFEGFLHNTTWEHLSCLSVLQIKGDDVVNTIMEMEMEKPLLPASLVSLEIFHMCHIECLDGKWLQHLTSLQNFKIERADKLKSLPEEGLPSSLSVLRINDCPLLEGSWQKKRGKEWRKIACIPCIVINGEIIT